MSSYTINKTDGSILTDNIPDGTVDTTATDLTLIGKNAVNYGEAFNENFVHLLENFANSSSPPNALVGQLWYDTGDNRLKVYTGNGFKVTGGTILSSSAPSNAIAGDIWIDTVNQQLKFYVDNTTYVLAGPAYTADQGISGIQIVSVYDTAEKEHTIGLLYIADSLIGIFSKDAFTPSPAISGFTGDIVKGFNLGNASGLSFDVPVTSATQLIDNENNIYIPDDFVKTSGSSVISYDAGYQATLTIQGDNPLILGSSENTEISSEPNEFKIRGVGQNQSITFESDTTEGYKGLKIYNPGVRIAGVASAVGDGTTLVLTYGNLVDGAVEEIVEPYQVGDEIDIYYYGIPGSVSSRQLLETATITAITTSTVSVTSTLSGLNTYVDPSDPLYNTQWDGEVRKSVLPRIGILVENPLVELDLNGRGLFRSDIRVRGAATVEGNLTVLGTTTSITTTNTTIKDNTITLNDGQATPGIDAGSAGIEIDRGPTNNLATWYFVEDTVSWTSNYYVDLKPISGLLNLEYRIEGASVLSADRLGTGVVNSSLTSVGTLVNLRVDNIYVNDNIIISDTGVVSVGNCQISNVATTAYDSSSPPQLVDVGKANNAVNNQTMQNYTAGLPLQFSLELTNALGGDLDDGDVITLLTDTFPVDDHALGTKIYVHCTKTTMNFDGITVTPQVARYLRVYVLVSGSPNNWYWDTSYNITYGF